MGPDCQPVKEGEEKKEVKKGDGPILAQFASPVREPYPELSLPSRASPSSFQPAEPSSEAGLLSRCPSRPAGRRPSRPASLSRPLLSHLCTSGPITLTPFSLFLFLF